MTGYYLRVQNNTGEWESIEIEHLTKEQFDSVFLQRNKDELLSWLWGMCKKYRDLSILWIKQGGSK